MQHFHERIQGWFDYQDVYRLILRKVPDDFCFCEMGVWKGKSLSFFAIEAINRNKPGRIIAVDHWMGSFEHRHRASPAYEPLLESEDGLYEHFLENIKPVRDRIEVVRKDSREAARDLPDASLDAVFIDGSHDYASVRGDIDAWFPKTKGRCVFAGHDFPMPGVNRAVKEFASSIGVEPRTSRNSWWFELSRETR